MAKSIPNYDTSSNDPFAGLPGYEGEKLAAPAPRWIRENNYGGKCKTCGVWVEPLRGRIERQDGKWVTFHKDGECPAPAEPAAVAPEPVTQDGMYRTPEGVIYKVQIAHHGSGNLYAKRMWLIEGWEFETHGKRKATFEFERGAIRKLTADMKMTLEQAKEFGALYGMCCKCGAILTDEYSISNGIGPICASKGW